MTDFNSRVFRSDSTGVYYNDVYESEEDYHRVYLFKWLKGYGSNEL